MQWDARLTRTCGRAEVAQSSFNVHACTIDCMFIERPGFEGFMMKPVIFSFRETCPNSAAVSVLYQSGHRILSHAE